MGMNSNIEWTHHTFNPWWGCVKVSPGCAHCYAETFAKRYGHDVWGKDAGRRFFGDKHWNEPVKWNREAKKAGERRRVFCASMADVFEDRPELHEPRFRLGKLIMDTPHLDWLILTKRPENIARLMQADHWMPTYGGGDYLPNIWLGTTVENQEQAEKRIPELLKVPAAVRFLSCEPLLGPVDISRLLVSKPCWLCGNLDGEAGRCYCGMTTPSEIHWVIAGGESGPGARPMHPDWVRGLRDQCQGADVPFFFKQWGEYAPVELLDVDGKGFVRVGKKAAGRELDGRLWDEFPRTVQA